MTKNAQRAAKKRRLASSYDDSESVVKVPYEKVSDKMYWKRWRLYNLKKRQNLQKKEACSKPGNEENDERRGPMRPVQKSFQVKK